MSAKGKQELALHTPSARWFAVHRGGMFEERFLLMQRQFERKLDALDGVFEFIDDFVSANGIDNQVGLQLGLVAEELFTNFVRHNSGGLDHILVALDRHGNQLVVRLTDFDVEPFDSEKTRHLDIRQPLSERKAGGLGIHIVKSIVDKLTYEYKDRTSIVTAIKNLEEENV